MNATYNYKTGRNNIRFDNIHSKKGSCRPFVRQRPAYVDFAERCLTIIDMILDFFCSARFIVRAKAVFGFMALLGFLALIGGIEAGSLSLVSGCICLTLVILLEYVILNDKETY